MNAPSNINIDSAHINFTDEFLQRAIETWKFFIDEDFSQTWYTSLWYKNPQMWSGYSLVTKSYLDRKWASQWIYSQEWEIIVWYINGTDPIYIHTSSENEIGAPIWVCANQSEINEMIHKILFAK